ncbi:ADP-ribosylglycohydrolase family protein [Alsobacter sp. SYSU M60028]|uniref:protein-tyrosine-phosphatase n=1 Tax=Alsobacter ponti TaxID=2962936 RepID=A0ABT1LGG7_9HYPH|nr:ADP-ribosylglycohydrolase family protein [Alsobacter ponti]MCP8939998.1 ADP-ribosylglycohydrolase family protein [Alsobacter ponti]
MSGKGGSMAGARTSETHPLQIAEVRPAPGHGLIGVTFAPGKHQADGHTGAWARDLGRDLDAVAAWNAAAVVTLVEAHELRDLRIAALGPEVRRRNMEWHHWPIADFGVPSAAFEAGWPDWSARLRTLLANGANVLVHCKGGLGRSGMIAARLLAEFGHPAEDAIAAVRQARPGAVETTAQERWVAAAATVGDDRPRAGTAEAVRDRALGALIGLAVGDAVGTTLEFQPKPATARLADMVGGGPFGLAPGQWTDDTAMALALAESLAAQGGLDPRDLIERFLDWRDNGATSCTGHCFDIGTTVNAALRRYQRTGDPFAGASEPHTAGNGALMRLAPVAVRYWANPAALAAAAEAQTRTTHQASEAIDASRLFAELLAEAIAGRPARDVLAPRPGAFAGAIGPIAAGSWRGRHRDTIRGSGYVAHCLEAALWAVGRSTDFRSAVLLAANLGEDADTSAAVAGQLAGALYGLSGIPEDWLARLAWRERLTQAATALFAAGAGEAENDDHGPGGPAG